ncbi:MAG: hypothetical protein HN833_01020 [Elusimicrobiaceae bacterium]|jgi:hypothetical protein|nr:hypothetical protein [Elusimicrobiaceae bacterium]MBT3955377.1 hypothetical protein [Elusimicrobiaceae bacterium]MBT4007654.1 hypothetical protein [Elusimicrobiaceae bacterium]MBT4403183.1 hypothetical protein [Elusimicrobiaceae bacterium]MBT4439569.1 hypothetical protein [Elusimicrobiaceae bacterium]
MGKIISIILISIFIIGCSSFNSSKEDKRKQDILSSINIYDEKETEAKKAKERTEQKPTPQDTTDYQESIILADDTVNAEELSPSVLEEIELEEELIPVEETVPVAKEETNLTQTSPQ